MAAGSWAPASGCDNQVEGKGEKRGKSNREYSSKVLASKDLHYICMGICVKRPYRWTELQNARIRGGYLLLSKTTLLAASVLQHVEESRMKSSK